MLTEKTENTGRIFLRISGGALIRKNREGIEQKYGSVSGILKKISLRENQSDDGPFQTWHAEIHDPASGERYDISAPRSSVAFKNIIRCLATPQGLNGLEDVKIEVYANNGGFNNSIVFSGGQKIRWDNNDGMPSIVKNGEERDDSEQMKWLLAAAERINAAAGDSEGDVSEDRNWSSYDEDIPED